jgi:hypothetical protein
VADYFDEGKHGAIVAIPFYHANATATLDGNANVLSSTASLRYVMPQSGSVVGISMRGNAGVTQGSLTATPTVGGVAFADYGVPQAVVNTTAATTQASYASVAPRVCQFDAGDALGISLKAAGTLAPETIDYDALLFVQFDPY